MDVTEEFWILMQFLSGKSFLLSKVPKGRPIKILMEKLVLWKSKSFLLEDASGSLEITKDGQSLLPLW